MKPLRILVASAALAAAPAALAQPINENPPTYTVICLDVSGRSLPVACQVPGSRVDKREDICICHEGTKTDVSICPKGVRAPAESLALEKARKAQAKHFSLIGATFEGRPICVEPRNTYGSR